MMDGRHITLAQLLAAREDRARAQQAILQQFHRPILSFTMNIAGPVKDTPLIRRAFQEGIRLFKASVSAQTILSSQQECKETGCAALYAVDMDAQALKNICVGIEEGSKLGRLFDMDVLDVHGKKLDRIGSRGCIVCGAPGRNCAARRLHSVDSLQAVTQSIIEDYFAEVDAEAVATAAVSSLLEEVNATPKPGLVDRRNNGSHKDMDLPMFTASALALKPYFQECFIIGRTQSQEEIFPSLRQAGLRAEKTMYQSTGGVNTHKGSIFTIGILCGSIGSLWSAVAPYPLPEAVFQQCALLAAPYVTADLSHLAGVTAGERLYLTRGITGARGEAAAGFPSVKKALALFRQQKAAGAEQNDALLRTLLYLIAHVDDTNLLHRGGPEGAQWASKAAASLLPYPTAAQLEALDDAFIEKNLSPGGCADLLAAAIFLNYRCSHCENLTAPFSQRAFYPS